MVVRYLLTFVSALTYAAALLAYFLLPFDYRHQATAAIVFAFPGTLTRYMLSIHLNPLSKTFPVGTFIANIFGTALLSAFHVIQGLTSPAISSPACSVVQGLSDGQSTVYSILNCSLTHDLIGYCGCLTTVSTFAVEVVTLRGRSKVRYVLASWTAAQLLLLVILGPSLLSGHTQKRTMCSFE